MMQNSWEEKTTLNLDPHLESSLCYLFLCGGALLIFLLETENKRVRFHALQSILLFAALLFITLACAILSIFTGAALFQFSNYFLWLLTVGVWGLLTINTFRRRTIKIIGLGDFAREQVGWPEE
jgi:uncharacterized membrane protein